MKSPFPQDWKEYTIGDCLRRVEHPVEVDSDALYTQIGIRSHGKGLFYKEPVTGELLGSKAVYWVEPNCFILNIVFAWEQAIGKTTQAEVGMIGSHRFPMYKPVNNLIDIDYLVYYLLTKRGTDILEAASPGGAGRNRTLGQDRFMKSRIVLPPLDEQQKIAEILSTQDKAIELQGRKIEELKRFKKGCLEKMFPRKGQKVPEKRFPGFTDDWEQRKLSEVFSSYTDPVDIPHDGYERLGIRSHAKGTFHSYVPAGHELQTAQMHRVAANKFIVNITFGWEHAVAVTDENDAGKLVSHRFPQFSLSDELDPQFLKFIILDERFRHHLWLASPGGAGRNRVLNLNQMLQYEIQIPCVAEQRKIAGTLINIDTLITLHQRKLEEMKKQKKALMQLLLTGIVRVRL